MDAHTTSGRWKLGLGLVFLTALIWGNGAVALKIVLDDMDPYTIAWYRMVISVAALAIIPAARKGRVFTAGMGMSGALLLLVAAAGVSGSAVFFMTGLERLPPSSAIVVIQLSNVFVLIGGLVIFKERFTALQYLGFALFVLGLCIFFNKKIAVLAQGTDDFAPGIILVAAAAFVWSGYALAQKQLLKKLSSFEIMIIVNAAGVIAFGPVCHPSQVLGLSGIQTGLLVFASLNALIGYVLFAESLKHVPASRASAVLALIPLVTFVSVRVVHGVLPDHITPEPLGALSIAGAFMVVAGSMLCALAAHPEDGAGQVPG